MISFQFQYRPFIQVDVSHSYFDNDSISYLKVIPDRSTESLIRDLGIVFKQEDFRFILLADQVNEDSFKVRLQRLEELRFGFWLSYGTPYFRGVTQGASLETDTLFYFSNENNKSELHQKSVVGKDEQITLLEDSPYKERVQSVEGIVVVGQEKFLVLPSLPLKYPLGYVELIFGAQELKSLIDSIDNGDGIPNQNYQINFESRELPWKYVLNSSSAQRLKNTLVLSDAKNIKFKGPVEEHERTGVNSVSFLSNSSLKLSEFSNYQFQLVEMNGSKVEKVIKKRLPVPRVDSVIKDNSSGELLAYIHINL
ncbi:hypothetical protein [Reichenbachiella versicolor]|uniref:hypothetical protein n=1 Tax=Reichenbachiella versicolor TaxID=1821036 RepID=UPI000D6E5E27|nr:hypothetical protein [Reichenbachiella versicolor]